MWVSTRKAGPAADNISANLIGRYVLHDVMSNSHVPLQEFSTADVVVFEIPPVVKPLFEHHLLDVVQRIRSTGPEVLIIVQPSLRRKSNKTLWVHKWNRLDKAPFRFHQTCSCKHDTEVQGCHLTCLICSSSEMHLEPCGGSPHTQRHIASREL